MTLVRFYIRNALDSERVDVVEARDGAVLVDMQGGKWSPLIPVSSLVRVELLELDDAASSPTADEAERERGEGEGAPENVGVPDASRSETRSPTSTDETTL